LLGEARAAIPRSRLDSCESGSGGGAIFAADGSQLLLEKSVVISCTTGRDGGAIVLLDASASVRNGELLSCKAGRNGGALWLGTSNLALFAVTIRGCDASEGGGLFLEMGEVHVAECTFEACTAVELGGGLALRGGSVQLRATLIVGCWSGRDAGGVVAGSGAHACHAGVPLRKYSVMDMRGLGSAMLVEQGGVALLQSSTIERCHSEMYATMYLEGNLTLTEGSKISDCTARNSGISGSSEDSSRGGVLWVLRGGVARLLQSTISNCHVLDLSTPKTYFAVASVDHRGTLELFHSTVRNNTVYSVTNDGASAIFVHRGGMLASVGLEIRISCAEAGVQSIRAEGPVQRRAAAPAPPAGPPRSAPADEFWRQHLFAHFALRRVR
jgi:hypothetical protein